MKKIQKRKEKKEEKVEYDNGDIYTVFFKGEEKSGKGVMNYKNGDSYDGN